MYLSIISILKLKSRPTGTNVEYHDIHSQVNLSITFCKTGTFNAGRDGHQFCVLATFFKSSYLKKQTIWFSEKFTNNEETNCIIQRNIFFRMNF